MEYTILSDTDSDEEDREPIISSRASYHSDRISTGQQEVQDDSRSENNGSTGHNTLGRLTHAQDHSTSHVGMHS